MSVDVERDLEFVDEFPEDTKPRPSTPSVLETLKAQRAKVAEEHTFDVVVPGWNELLVLRLGSITSEQQAKMAERVQKLGIGRAGTFLLVAAFRSALGRTSPTDDLVELVDADDDPLGLDRRLADALDLGPVASARDVVEALFSRANSPTTAITAATNDWYEWAASAEEEIDDEFVGE